MPQLLKKTLRFAVIFAGAIVLLYLIAFAYISINKKSIIKNVTEDISEKLDGNVTVGNVELSFLRTFPRAAVLLTNISITDTMYASHGQKFLQAEEIFAQLSITRLVTRRSPVRGVEIRRAAVKLFTDSSGYTNTYLLKPRNKPDAAKKKGSKKSELKNITLTDVHLVVDDRRKKKLHDFLVDDLEVNLDNAEVQSILSVRSDIRVKSLAFNLQAGSFVKDKRFEGRFELMLDKTADKLRLQNINVKIGGHPFRISGFFDLKGPAPQFSLEINSRGLPYSFGRSLLTEKIARGLSIVNLDNKIDLEANIKGPLKKGQPLVVVKCNVKNSHMTTPFFDFDDATFSGVYTNEVTPGLPRSDPNSKVTVIGFSANWYGLPVTSSRIEIVNLLEPNVTCDLRSAFPLTKLNELLGGTTIVLESGTGNVALTYKGPIVRNNNTNSLINGAITFSDGTIMYTPRDVKLNAVNGSLAFRGSNVFVQNLQCEVLKNKIVMDGEARNLLTLINTEPDKVIIDWNIFSPSLNLSDFTYLLKSRKKSTYKAQRKSKLGDVAQKIDAVLEQGRLNVHLKALTMTYKKLQAKNVVANVLLLQDRYIINEVNMEQAGGRMNLKGSLISQADNYNKANLNVVFDNVDVNKVFSEFNNFGQDAITAENLSGRLDAKVKANLTLDNNGKAYPGSIVSQVDFSLKKGVLNNYEPVKKLQNFLFKNRDFENIEFAELKNKLEIADQEIKINRMEIQSSVLTLFVEGVYSTKGATDMSIQVPLSNLKQRKNDYKPENKGSDRKAGASIYLRGRPGSDGNIQFKLDVFKKFRKDDS